MIEVANADIVGMYSSFMIAAGYLKKQKINIYLKY